MASREYAHGNGSRGPVIESLPRQRLAIVWMRDGNQRASPLAAGEAFQVRNAEFSHDVIHIAARGDHASTVLQARHDARRPMLGA